MRKGSRFMFGKNKNREELEKLYHLLERATEEIISLHERLGEKAYSCCIKEEENNTPIAQVKITIETEDERVMAEGTTDESGKAHFWLPSGTYYIYSHKEGSRFPIQRIEI